jgi:alcohol dehydrogenase
MRNQEQAAELLRRFKGDRYAFGLGCFDCIGPAVAALGARAAVVSSGAGKAWGEPLRAATLRALRGAGVELAGEVIAGARPNAPREDVLRIAAALSERRPEVVLAVGGGSVIDAAKAALAYAALGDRHPDLDAYFGAGQVTTLLQKEGRALAPLAAAQLAAGSAAHLTRYSNVTDTAQGQKLLIIDDALVPQRAVFDYARTTSMSADFTMDGAFDGVAHCLEVLMGVGAPLLAQAEPVCLLGIELIVGSVKAACRDPQDLAAREALGLGTDLGGYAIMLGGTSGAHLNSFSLVDILPHGRACALMNPYYVVFFAPAIEPRLRPVAALYRRAGYLAADPERLHGRDLGVAVAEAMLALSRDVGFPTSLQEVPGFTEAHVHRALAAAANPKLESKLRNMPIPLSAANVAEYMAPILDAARSGDLSRVRAF